tara:strand:- start:1653 stop:2051 length:399 start_codon:yes stop_codon:yes gene_type:complete
MDEIFDTINSLILKTAGGLIAIWGLAVYALVKIATFLGGCAAEGAINKALTKMVPLVKAQFLIEFESIKEDVAQLKEEVGDLKSSIEKYRKVKHDIETENQYLGEALISKDEEMLKEFREILIKREKRKKYE